MKSVCVKAPFSSYHCHTAPSDTPRWTSVTAPPHPRPRLARNWNPWIKSQHHRNYNLLHNAKVKPTSMICQRKNQWLIPHPKNLLFVWAGVQTLNEKRTKMDFNKVKTFLPFFFFFRYFKMHWEFHQITKMSMFKRFKRKGTSLYSKSVHVIHF